MADVFFRILYKSFTIICFHANFFSFSFVDKTRRAVRVIYLLISVQFTFSMHSELYSSAFTSVNNSRRCWSLDLVRTRLFVMSIFTLTFFVVLFFIWLSHEVFFPVWAESDDNA